MVKNFYQIIILLVLVTTINLLVLSDLGSYADQPAGAGDIWWADVQAIEDAYQKTKFLKE